MIDYGEFVELAHELINEAGRLVQFQQISNEADNPDKPWAGSTSSPTTTEQIMACFLPASGSGFGRDIATEDMLKRVSQVLLVAQCPHNLENFHKVVDADTTWTIDWITTLKPGNTVVMYAMGLKQ